VKVCLTEKIGPTIASPNWGAWVISGEAVSPREMKTIGETDFRALSFTLGGEGKKRKIHIYCKGEGLRAPKEAVYFVREKGWGRWLVSGPKKKTFLTTTDWRRCVHRGGGLPKGGRAGTVR